MLVHLGARLGDVYLEVTPCSVELVTGLLAVSPIDAQHTTALGHHCDARRSGEAREVADVRERTDEDRVEASPFEPRSNRIKSLANDDRSEPRHV
jgi:hypothetical protein